MDVGYDLLDVRSKSEYEKSHIKGSQWFPGGEVMENIHKLKKGKDYCCVFKTGYTSTVIA